MSRIHDALRKAAQDRVPAPPAEAVILPQDLSVTPATAAEAPQTSPSADSVEIELETPPTPRDRPEASEMAGPAFDSGTGEDFLTRCARPTWHPEANGNVFLNPEITLEGAERFRTLRLKLYEMRAQQQLRTLVVTSAIPGDGKTWVVSNLAHGMVRQPNRRVLLIDADLRGARLHEVLGAPSAPGLTDYLTGEADETKVVQRGTEGNLYFIAAGNPAKSPAELLANGRMKELLERVTPAFDWVLLDSPPCLSVADASLLAGYCDGVLMVVRAGSTPAELAQKATRDLSGKNIVGVVLNAVETSANYESSYSGSGAKVRSSNGNGLGLSKDGSLRR